MTGPTSVRMPDPNDTLASIAREAPQSLIFNRGLERETLRVDKEGQLALTPHPAFLGSKLCHPLITTDFSESQLELITPVHDTTQHALNHLDDIHRYVYSGLDHEMLWPASLPCALPSDRVIPIAQFGTSNAGRLKTTYRSGLGHRYGRTMQTICAIHYNFSFQDSFWQALAAAEHATEPSQRFRNRRYFDLMRNFRRLSWLPTYLFGASPAASNAFLTNREHSLKRLDSDTLYLPNATSLRSGGLGYQSATQAGLVSICYNSLSDYVRSLALAICTKHSAYANTGVGTTGTARMQQPIQLNTNVLQSEAEFYTTIRAKRVPRDENNLLAALDREGVEYIEVRLLDVDPFAPLGIDAETIDFMDMLLLYCILEPSPHHDDALCLAVDTNMDAAVRLGRGTLELDNMGTPTRLQSWGQEVLAELGPIAATLDATTDSTRYSSTLAIQQSKLLNPELTPSARMLSAMGDSSFHEFALTIAHQHKQHFRAQPMDKGAYQELRELAADSSRRQASMEAQPQVPFGEYIARLQQRYENVLEYGSP